MSLAGQWATWIGSVVALVIDRLHLWIALRFLAIAIVLIALKQPPTANSQRILTAVSYGQLLIPGGLWALLSALGADHEGGWADSNSRIAVSTLLVVAPLLVGVILTCVCKNRRWLTALIGAFSSILGSLFLWCNMLIGT